MNPGIPHPWLTGGIQGVLLALTLAFYALVAMALVYLIRWLAVQGSSRQGALGILKARYARGEITREQFLAMKRDIEDG